MKNRQGPGQNETDKKTGRNSPCPCGSGRKYKICCGRTHSVPLKNRHERSTPIKPDKQTQLAITQAARELDAGRAQEAFTTLRKAVAFNPKNFMLHLELGNLLLRCGRPGEALPWFDQAVRLQFDSALAHMRRGFALEQLGWPTEAIESYRKAISLSPSLPEAHSRLGTALLAQDNKKEAAGSFRRVAALVPKTTLGKLSEAQALLAEGASSEALIAFRKIVALNPKSAAAYAALGKLLAETGCADDARAAFMKAVDLDPRAAGYYYDITRIRRLAEDDRPLLFRMVEVLQRNDLHDIHRIMLHLAIGKAYEDLNEQEQAIEHYLAANKIKGDIRPLDRDMITKRVDWMISTFTKEFYKRNDLVKSPDQTPVFILGMPRSGTTLVESILANHSCVYAGQELSFWSRCGRNMVTADSLPSDKVLGEIADSYLAILHDISNFPRVTDKKPDNFFWVGLIHLVFPEARIIHCRRNPLDTCVSILSNFFAPRPDFSTEPNDLVYYYREYERIMAHWRTVVPADRFLELEYETLVSESEATIRNFISFCGLNWEETCLFPERSSRSVNTASLWQVRKPIFKDSINRWRQWGPWLGDLLSLM